MYDATIDLLELGLDPNITDSDGLTPFFYAVKLGHVDVVTALLDSGADTKIVAPNGNTVMFFIDNKVTAPEIIRLLLRFGADINHQNTEGQTALHTYAVSTNMEIFSALVDAGAEIESRDTEGRTPLFSVSTLPPTYRRGRLIDNNASDWERRFKIMQILTDAGADINATNNDGVSAMSVLPFIWDTVPQDLIDKMHELGAINIPQTDEGCAILKANDFADIKVRRANELVLDQARFQTQTEAQCE